MVLVQATMSSKLREEPALFAMIICLIQQNYTASIFFAKNVSQRGLTEKKHAQCAGLRYVEIYRSDNSIDQENGIEQKLDIFWSL